MKKLVIISHTEHQVKNKQYFGWGPTVSEINYLANYWDSIVHVGCLERGVTKKPSSLPYAARNIQFIPIPTFGGTKWWQKFDILVKFFFIIYQIEKNLKGASHVQIRVPMGIGVLLIPYFSVRKRNFILWVKYANNWGDINPKIGFRLQRYMLSKNWAHCKVTINGFWANQPNHCHSFENPCLYQKEIDSYNNSRKIYKPPFEFIFVGRLEDEKGVHMILDYLKTINEDWWCKMHFVGDGFKMNAYREKAKCFGSKVVFYGFLERSMVHDLFKRAHFLLFPSYASEGFPKVLAEASAFGCVPVTSTVASIGHYIKDEFNGFHWENWENRELETLAISSAKLRAMSHTAELFTYENYYLKLTKLVFEI